jgi:hypothetical protein
MEYKVILTPIAKTMKRKGPDSRRDYVSQMMRVIQGETLMWDDVSPKNGGNRARVGDLFGFVFNTVPSNGEVPRVVFHRVTEVRPVSDRCAEWYANVGQTDRQVVFLSDKVGELSQAEFIEYGGYKVQGTQYVGKQVLRESLLYLF